MRIEIKYPKKVRIENGKLSSLPTIKLTGDPTDGDYVLVNYTKGIYSKLEPKPLPTELPEDSIVEVRVNPTMNIWEKRHIKRIIGESVVVYTHGRSSKTTTDTLTYHRGDWRAVSNE